MRTRPLWFAVLAWLTISSLASAQAEDPSTEAKALFEHGISLAGESRWGEALVYFRRSAALAERPSTVFNIGVALLRMGKPTEATRSFQRFMRISDPRAEAQRRAQAEEMMRTAERTISHLTIHLTPETAELNVDGNQTSDTGPRRVLALDPGSHAIVAELADYSSVRLELSLLPGENTERRVQLAPLGRELTPERTSTTQTEPTRSKSTSIFKSPIFWIITGVAVVGIGVGVGFAISESSKTDKPYPGTTGVVLQGLQ